MRFFALTIFLIISACENDRIYYLIDSKTGGKTKVSYCKEDLGNIIAYRPAVANETLFVLNRNYSVKNYDSQKYSCIFVNVL